jgi:excinuclease ABC subunit C
MTTTIADIPSLPGVYLFKNRAGTVIYIGKAKNLKKRIVTYFRSTYQDWKHASLMRDYADLEYIITNTEDECLLLEAELIQRYQPKYNMLFKEGQPFVYIVFSKDELPRAAIVRTKKAKGTYFGPFLHKTDARRVLKFLTDTFKLTICDKKMSGGCLRYHLNLCAGSCRDDFNTNDYLFRVHLAMSVLKNDQDAFLEALTNQIAYYNKEHAFEQSRRLHGYVENFKKIFATIQTHYTTQRFVPEVAKVTAPSDQYTPRKRNEDLAIALQELLHAPKPLHTIDCFDISHIQGRAMVGSCVRFADGLPVPNKFRRFSIKTLSQQNDYAALQEIVRRRYRDKNDLPDLVFIDGGKGQLNAVQAVLPEALCASIAKREETLFSSTLPDGMRLHLDSDIGKTLISLRDYAHHFAITYHRLVRSKKNSS